MEKHLGFLERRCRLCGKTFSKVKTVQNCDKTAFRRELLNFFGVDIGLDSREIHPQKVCSACRRVVYHLNSGNLDPETSEGRKQGIKPFVWKEHSYNFLIYFSFFLLYFALGYDMQGGKCEEWLKIHFKLDTKWSILQNCSIFYNYSQTPLQLIWTLKGP